MRPSPELDDLRRRLQDTAGELGLELNALLQDSHLELAPAGDQLEDIGDEYVRLSDELASSIESAAEDQDAEAVRQLTRLIGLDLEVAQRLVLLSDFEDPAGAGPESFFEGMPEDPVSAELAQLDDLGSVAAAALSPARPTSTFEAGLEGPAGTDIAVPVEAILDEAAKTISSTAREIGWAKAGGDFLALAAQLAGEGAREQVARVVSAAKELWRRASRLAASVLGSVLAKLTRFVGAERLAKVLDTIKDKVVGWWDSVPGDGVVAKGLALAMRSDDIVRSSRAHLDGRPPETVATAVAACDELAEQHRDGLVWVRRGNKALGWAGGVKAFMSLSGAATLVALVGVALIGYTSWVTHDFLDSPALADHIPGRVRGIGQTVAAVAGE